MSKEVTNIHDAFFKKALSDPELAGTFLREHLPPDVAGLLGSEAPEPCDATFVDEDLRQHHSDLIFRIQLKAGQSAFAYVLMEHKSSPDQGARLQLLRYVVLLLIDCYKRNKRRLPLPPVLPLLASHGPKGWEISCEFADLFGTVPHALRRYLPSFRHVLVDLTKVKDRNLSAHVRLRAFLKALKYARCADLPDKISAIFADALELGKTDLLVILRYLNEGPIKVDRRRIDDALLRLGPERKELIMGWFSQPYYEQGISDGERKGEAQGEAKALIRHLKKRFGTIPASICERVFAADVGSLEVWAERVFDAPDVESVFDTN